jgi:integrase
MPMAPAVFARLNEKPQNSARLLQFIMLTAVRFGEAAKATWAEMDIEAEVPVFTIPAERMKMRRLHRVPLSQPAIEILTGLRREKDKPGDLVFNGQVRGNPIADTTVRNLLRRVGPDGAQTHGLRSTFRDWAADHGYDRDVAEAALAHSLGDDVTVAYLRSDLFQRRVKLMEDWAEYLTGG